MSFYMANKKSTDRVRAYRERKRASKPPKKPPKTTLERSRDYRARKKALKARVDLDDPIGSNGSSIDNQLSELSTSRDALSGFDDSLDSEVPSRSEDLCADFDEPIKYDSDVPSTSRQAFSVPGNKINFDDRVKPKNVLALNEKVAAIRRYEADPVYKSVGRFFNCSPDQIKRIIKQKNEILAEWNNRTKKSALPTSHELKSVKLSFLGKAVHEWIRRMMYYTDFKLTNALIQTMAIEFKKVLGLQAFFPDKNWIANFRSSYGLKDVNTKTLEIGYREGHSVQIRDILRHMHSVCGSNGDYLEGQTPPTIKSEQCMEESMQITETESVDDCSIKEEADDECPSDDVKMEDEDSVCNVPCSSSSVSPVIPAKPVTVPFTLPSTITVALVTVKPPVSQPQTTQIRRVPINVPSKIVKLTKTKKPSPSKPAKVNFIKEVINTHDDAINCVRMLEDFALLKENFRLIGLIERLEEALKDTP